MKMEASCIFESSSATPQDINLSDVKVPKFLGAKNISKDFIFPVTIFK